MEQKKLERCGFCGQFFIGLEYLTVDELNSTPKERLDAAPLGYCPNAEAEANQNEPERQRITRDMAIDAGDPTLEGQLL